MPNSESANSFLHLVQNMQHNNRGKRTYPTQFPNTRIRAIVWVDKNSALPPAPRPQCPALLLLQQHSFIGLLSFGDSNPTILDQTNGSSSQKRKLESTKPNGTPNPTTLNERNGSSNQIPIKAPAILHQMETQTQQY